MSQVPIAVQSVGWTWTATMQAVQVVLTVVLGTGGVYGIARGVALLWKMSNETKKLDSDGSAAVRKEMMELNDRQKLRIDALEKDLREERKQYDAETAQLRAAHIAEMADLRKVHADEMRALHERIEGLHRQMVLMQQATGRAIRNGVNAPASGSRMPEDHSRIGDALKQAYDIPGTGEDE